MYVPSMFLRQAMFIPKLKGYKVSSISKEKEEEEERKVELIIYDLP